MPRVCYDTVIRTQVANVLIEMLDKKLLLSLLGENVS